MARCQPPTLISRLFSFNDSLAVVLFSAKLIFCLRELSSNQTALETTDKHFFKETGEETIGVLSYVNWEREATLCHPPSPSETRSMKIYG